MFKGEVFVGPMTRTYDVPAIAEGYYLFQCDPHDDMEGWPDERIWDELSARLATNPARCLICSLFPSSII